MKTGPSAGRRTAARSAVLLVLFLFGGGALANWYIAAGVRHADAGGAGQGAERPVALSARFPGETAQAISRERNAGVLKNVFEVFDPALLPFLAAVPIVLDSSADTAKAYLDRGYIGVSPDWDNTVMQSRFRTVYEQRGMKHDDQVFSHRFKTDLLIHEFLHLLQVQRGIDRRAFHDAVARWYADPRYGIPSPAGMSRSGTAGEGARDAEIGNRTKYILWHALYNPRGLTETPPDGRWKDMQYGKRYRLSEQGVEEFAYIGQEMLASGSASGNYARTGQWDAEDWKSKKARLLEISPEVIEFFRGVFNPELVQ